MRVFLSKTAENKLADLLEYLLENWNQKVRNDFIDRLKGKIKQISLQPESCPTSREIKGLYKCVVSKQNTFYYRINRNDQTIEIITFIDSRKSMKSIAREIKSFEA